jgi:predicted nucleotide-binding protein
MSIEFLDTDYEKVSYLMNLLMAHATGKDADDGEYQHLRNELLQKKRIGSLLPPWIKTHRSLHSFWGFIRDKYGTYADRRRFLNEEFEEALNLLEFGESAESTEQKKESPPLPWATSDSPKKKVFVVHGRDNEAKQEVSRHIESLGIEVIILHEKASSGMTIIEKIEHYSDDADFAIILYTACDHGRGIHEKNVHPKNRARQNVVFEHGYLMAKLGRENVCALVKGEIETPNDISGVVYVPLDPPGAWKIEVNKELKACGYNLTP